MSTSPSKPKARLPVLFVGHGSPMNAIVDNAWSRGFRALGRALPRPEAILAISAHWYVEGTFSTANQAPETIHDFGGFPRELFQVQYPAPGSPGLAGRAVELLGPHRASLRSDWGLDHGTWSVLVHTHPGPLPAAAVRGRRELGVGPGQLPHHRVRPRLALDALRAVGLTPGESRPTSARPGASRARGPGGAQATCRCTQQGC